MRKRSSKRFAALIPIMAAIIVAVIMKETRPETILERTHRICKDCGMYPIEIDELIQQVRESGLSPAESIRLWKQTAEPDAVELCMPCVNAVIEVSTD